MINYSELFFNHLQSYHSKKTPVGLYEPVTYLLELGGKRIRPMLTLMATEVFGGNVEKSLPAALSVELFHNFTLMHDDIMDDAPLRRGQQTVHEKWDLNTGILSGDVMLIKAYQSLEAYPDELFSKLTRLLSKTAVEVCEGQQYDVDFETQSETTIEAYLEMIRLKTAVLVGCALKMGVYIAEGDENEAQKLYDFGILLGMAFQIQDDYLDAFGDPKTFGKQVGGDIIENKKTILYHKALSIGSAAQKTQLKEWFEAGKEFKVDAKIAAVQTLFTETGAAAASQKLMQDYTQEAFIVLDSLRISPEKKQLLVNFANQLMQRKH
ncbi:polyprenyl synthetase family protein [Flavobacteriaceae bacterium]|nr:polyprenyl synthetase family protein [Flavobacteriaceae bacterium]